MGLGEGGGIGLGTDNGRAASYRCPGDIAGGRRGLHHQAINPNLHRHLHLHLRRAPLQGMRARWVGGSGRKARGSGTLAQPQGEVRRLVLKSCRHAVGAWTRSVVRARR